MGESSCLMRSFSQSSEHSGEVKEGGALRCLGESISFGRYASERLDWEKWSAFSHNRYLEEVEKFSKPGSVAQKKAYFEAHYKKKAAEKAAALLEEANMCASQVSESVIVHKNFQSSFMDIDLANGESHMAIDVNQQENFVPSFEVVYSAYVNDHNPDVEGNQLEIAKVDGAQETIQESVSVEDAVQVEVRNSIQDEIETSIQVEMENSTLDEFSHQIENDKDQTEIVSSATQEEKMPNKEAASEENLSSTSKKRLVNSSPSRLSTLGRASKIPYFPAKQTTGVPTINKNSATPKSKNSEADLVDKRRSTTKSLHMSINFTSHASEASKRISPVLEKIKNVRVNATLSVNNSASLRTTTRASVNGVLKQSSVNPWSKDRRAKTILNKSVSGSVTADRICKSPSKGQSSTANGSKPRGPIKSCPFSLRSEERAAKRKEFFQRLEEKKNGEAENKQLQMRSNKEKAVRDVKKLYQSTGLKAKLNEDLSSGSQLLSNNLKKIPPTRSQSQKLERHSTTSKVPDPSTRPSVNSHSSKRVTQKYNPRTSQSVTSLPKKNAHENSSPNIQS